MASPVVRSRIAPPAAAFASGWMPLAPTKADQFVKRYPTYDGRGVLIAILDSGIDPGVEGLQETSTGLRKVLDVRDFSGEGRVELEPANPSGDSVVVAGRTLTGFGRVVAVSAVPRFFQGTIREMPLGTLRSPAPNGGPASDLNDNGHSTDTLSVIVTKARDGWVVFADTDGDGSLADERPVRDYRVAPETIGWQREGSASPPPMSVAVNFRDNGEDAAPDLTMAFDNSGHGTHVAGIAAGNRLYGIPGFNGVAPGAQLLGLKIANNAHGGISVTGSMLRAIDYAIEFARARQLPLVLNMSFGVGNEREGSARIDHVVDSILADHPNVMFTVSAGNDGPGLSTIGFPGSARRGITVGASFPLVFVLPPGVPAPRPDPVAFFSARGGELAKPDIIVPGVAYSTVPRWNTGGERNLGTSMAAPHAAGLAALLASALIQERGTQGTANQIKRALTLTARPVEGTSSLDDGAGVPDVVQAYLWLKQERKEFEVVVEALRDGLPVGSAAFRRRGLGSPPDTVQTFRVSHRNLPTRTIRLQALEPWLSVPSAIEIVDSVIEIDVTYRPPETLRRSGVYHGRVIAWGTDSLDGPLFQLLNTVVVPYAPGENIRIGPVRIGPGGVHRVFFHAEAGRPFLVTVHTVDGQTPVLTSLHEPGGQPYRDGVGIPAGGGGGGGGGGAVGGEGQAAVYMVRGGDALAGVYELDVIASPAAPARAVVEVIHAALSFEDIASQGAGDGGRSKRTTITNATNGSVSGTASAQQLGVRRRLVVRGRGSNERRIPFTVPRWAAQVEIDVAMDPAGWGRFTDFGATVFDALGRIVTRSPLNYAHERIDTPVDPQGGDLPLELVLVPGFADAPAGDDVPWEVEIDIRLYEDDASPRSPATPSVPFSLDAGGSEAVVLPAGAAGRNGNAREADPGFWPLYRVQVETGGRRWLHEPAGTPP